MIIDHQVSFAENPNNRNLLRMGINLFPNMVLTNNMDGISFFFPVCLKGPGAGGSWLGCGLGRPVGCSSALGM